MAGWMKTPLGTEVDLGPGHIVLDGVLAPAKGAQRSPLFGPCLLWPRSPISATAELYFLFFFCGRYKAENALTIFQFTIRPIYTCN